MGNRATTRTGSQGCLGVVSGYVAKLGRQAAGVTQERLAELLEVDVSTVQGWESGRRPLGAMPTAQLMRLRMHLVRLGAPASLGRHLVDALEADLLLATCMDLGTSWPGRGVHPLAATVHRRSLINLVTWPLTGETPPQLAEFAPKRKPRGPAASRPVVYSDEQHQFFDHLLAVANRSSAAEDALLRTQAAYLLAFDGRSDADAWLCAEQRRAVNRRRTDGLTDHLDVRTASVARASVGDPELLEYFVAGLSSEQQQVMNLNYWAYWIGEIADDQPNDSFMVETDPQSWHGARLLRHLTSRLRPDAPHLALNLCTLHSLVACRPSLLTGSPQGRRLLSGALDLVDAHPGLNHVGRQQLAGLAYSVRIADR